MARGGLYKSDIQKARDTLRAQGKHPSVDAGCWRASRTDPLSAVMRG